MIRLHNVERCHPLAKGNFFYVLRDIDLEIAEGEFVSISLLLVSIALPVCFLSALWALAVDPIQALRTECYE